MDIVSALSVSSSSRAAVTSGIAGRIRPVQLEPKAEATAFGSDSVEFSDEARGVADSFPPDRARKIALIKEQIADGTYLNPEKFDRAIDRLLQDIENSQG